MSYGQGMSDTTPDGPAPLPNLQTVRALALMRNALVLLDDAGEGVAASHLQFAIDTLDPSQSATAEK